ncbi:NAD(P)H-hydrate epimerase [Candidatus Woesearchaeota archaeon]|nr:NAD(P)H-hydrate epimerase [Candidatus Woesearchaeota archaeon]
MLTTKEMIKMEESAVEQGISRLHLMERAGKGLAEHIRTRVPKGKKILFLTLHGNNGGDGFVAARELQDEYHVDIWFLGSKKKLREGAKHNHKKLHPRLFVDTANLEKYDCLVDALLGTGAEGGLKEPLKSLSKKWNETPAFKVAVDIPTGLHPDTGEHEDLFWPDLIVTFHDLKTGLKDWQDKTVVVDIGIP